MNYNNFTPQQLFLQQQQQQQMLQRQQGALDWKQTLSDANRKEVVQKIAQALYNTYPVEKKSPTELQTVYLQVVDYENKIFDNAQSREHYLTQVSTQIRMFEERSKAAPIKATQQQQTRPIQTSNFASLNAAQRQHFLSQCNPEVLHQLKVQQALHTQQQQQQQQHQEQQQQQNQQVKSNSQQVKIEANLLQVLLLKFSQMSANVSQKDVSVVQRLQQEPAMKGRQLVEQQLSLMEKSQVNQHLPVFSQLYPHLDNLIYSIAMLNPTDGNSRIEKLKNLKRIIFEQMQMSTAKRDVYYFSPQICAQVLHSLRDDIIYFESNSKKSMQSIQVLSGKARSKDEEFARLAVKEIFHRDFGLSKNKQDSPNVPFQISPLFSRVAQRDAEALFGSVKVVERPDLFSEDEPSLYKSQYSLLIPAPVASTTIQKTLEEEMIILSNQFEVAYTIQRLGSLISITLIGGAAMIALSVREPLSSDSIYTLDLSNGLPDQTSSGLKQRLAEGNDIISCVGSIFQRRE